MCIVYHYFCSLAIVGMKNRYITVVNMLIQCVATEVAYPWMTELVTAKNEQLRK